MCWRDCSGTNTASPTKGSRMRLHQVLTSLSIYKPIIEWQPMESSWSNYGGNIGQCFAIACHYTFLKENVQCIKAKERSETSSGVKAFEATFKNLYPASNFQRPFSVIFKAEATAHVRTMVLIKRSSLNLALPVSLSLSFYPNRITVQEFQWYRALERYVRLLSKSCLGHTIHMKRM